MIDDILADSEFTPGATGSRRTDAPMGPTVKQKDVRLHITRTIVLQMMR